MFEVLKSVQASIVELRADIDGVRAEMRAGHAELKELAHKQRRDMAGILVIMKGTAGVFEERVTNLESRVTVLEQDRRT